jgi:hypothetical protein
MIIMIAANKMNPTAQPLVASAALPADRYFGAACSLICGPLLCLLLGTAVSVGRPTDGRSLAPGAGTVITQRG